MSHELEQNILAGVSFSKVSATGYHELKCPVCQDYKVRAGFKFEPDKIIYNCFRGKCDASTVYEYGQPLSRKFRHLLNVLNVDIPIELRSKGRKKPKAFEDLDNARYERHNYKEVTFPEDFVEFNPDKHWWLNKIIEARRVDFKRKLFVGQKDEWKNRLIVPFYFNGKLIGWQGINKSRNPYLKSTGNIDIIYINNVYGRIPEEPLIVEGLMDAAVLPDGVAVLGRKITKRHAYLLKNTNPILIPDRNYSKFLQAAKVYGWRISIPEWQVKDVNEAVQVYGKFVTAQMIYNGIQNNLLKAETKYKLWHK